MKKIVRFGLMIGLLALAIASATGQSTNVVQRANFVLKGRIQTSSGVKSVRVVNKDIIAALNETGKFNFGQKAVLSFVGGEDDQAPAIVVREVNGEVITTDVGDYFGVTEVGSEVHSHNDRTRWETWNFAFNNGTTNETAFLLWGATTIHRGEIHSRSIGTIEGSRRIQSDVRGVGRVEGAVTIFSGSVFSASSTLVKS